MVRLAGLVMLVGALALAPAAQAQFGGIFGNEPPRPPASVPNPPELLPPPPASPPISARPPNAVQSQPLPPPDVRSPPPGASTQAPAAPSAVTTAPLSEEVITTPPAPKIANPIAVFSGLDKITGRIIAFEVEIDETVRFGALEVTPRVCYTRPPTETPHTDGFVEVDELTLQGELRRIFTGWMFAASPGLNAVEHPIYDVWLTDCKGGSPPALTVNAPAAERRSPPRSPQRGTAR